MKSGLIVLAAATVINSGMPTGERIALRELTESPKAYIGRQIIAPGIGCVDNPKGGFLCVAVVGGQALRIEASVLGARTKVEIAERLTGDCKGTANLSRSACRFDAGIEPTAGYRDTMETPSGSMPITVIVSPSIEMYRPVRR
jgi:hypothetical protein